MRTVTRYFVNRTSEIERLNSALKSEGPEKDSLVLVYGQPGIGKTQLLAKYLRDCNYDNTRIAYVDLQDLITKGYLGLIETIVEGLGNSGFEELDETVDDILIRSRIEKSKSSAERAQEQVPIQAPSQAQGFIINGPVTARDPTFIHGNVTYNNPKFENIYNIYLTETEQVAEWIQNRISRAFRNCLQNISKDQLIVILLDQWEKASNPLQVWLDAHLLRWASELTLKKALIVLSYEALPPDKQNQLGILPMAVPPFSREAALEFWKKNGLAEEEFSSIGVDIYSIPSALSFVAGVVARVLDAGKRMNSNWSNSDSAGLVSEFLELLPESTKRVVRLASIPNAINSDIIQKMIGEQINVTNILKTLQQYYFLNKGEGDWYYFSINVREVLRAFWKQPEQTDEFQKANHILIAYFDDRAKKTNPPGNYTFQREALYHRLLEDENMGLEYMADLFEQACDQRQIGAAQNLSIQLTQTMPQLSTIAGQYASYYEMRLDFMLNRRNNLDENLEVLTNEISDPLLKARAGILLGQVWLVKYEWKKSADILKASLKVLKKLKAWRYAARAMLALGDIYVDLVENNGGLELESANELSRLSRVLKLILLLPFLPLDWLRRKIWFFPGWFYFSGDYQEWILNYLLQIAGNWYKKAWDTSQIIGDDVTSLNALMGQANVAIQQRREAKARRLYSRLAHTPAVHSSRYRLAQVFFGQGQISSLANRAVQANRELQSALDIFRSFADEANIAAVARALAATYLRLGDNESAAKAFLESFQAYREMHDPLPQTQVSAELEQLVDKKQIAAFVNGQIKEALANIQAKQYLARFRTFAYWFALPLAYILVLFIGIVACLSSIIIEFSASQASNIYKMSQMELLFLIVTGVLPIFLAFWIFELVYAVVGQVWLFIFGHNSLNSLGEQPDRVILTSEAIIVNQPGPTESIQLTWNEIQTLISADYRLWQRPIYLLSQQTIISGSKSIVIDGVTNGYTQIRKEILQKIGDTVHQFNADLVALAHRSTYITVLVAALYAQVMVSAGLIEVTVMNTETGKIGPVYLAGLLVTFIVNMITIIPPLLLWRMVLQRRLFNKWVGNHLGGYRNFVPLSFAILFSIVAILWLVGLWFQ